MSIVRAYGCDYCGVIKPDKRMIGISPVADMFDKKISYPVVFTKLDRVPFHFCLECYHSHVTSPAENESPKKKDAFLHADLIEDYSYLFRLKCIANRKQKKYFK